MHVHAHVRLSMHTFSTIYTLISPELSTTYCNLPQLTSTYLTAWHPTSMYRILPFKQFIFV